MGFAVGTIVRLVGNGGMWGEYGRVTSQSEADEKWNRKMDRCSDNLVWVTALNPKSYLDHGDRPYRWDYDLLELVPVRSHLQKWLSK